MTVAMLAATMPWAKAATINVGNCFLAPNRAEQTVRIFISGGELVDGLNFYAQIGDGGPDLVEFGLPAGTPAPIITAVDLENGTIFDSVADPQSDDGSLPQVVFYSIELQEGADPVPAQGLLATLTMDASGFFFSETEVCLWDFLLTDILGNPLCRTDLAGIPIDIQNGTIGITIDGDCTLDGRVDGADATVLAANWQTSVGGQSGDGIGWTNGDFNDDGIVNDVDVDILVQNWLQSAPVEMDASAVPEPAAGVFFATFLLFWTLGLRLRGR